MIGMIGSTSPARLTRIRRTPSRAVALLVFLLVTLVALAAHAVVVRTAVAYRPVPVVRPVAPVARTAAVVGAAAVTAVAVGTVVRTLPAGCGSVMVGNVAYQQCGTTWYQPTYSGTTVTYTVVNPPQ
jgi:hypothetical protein